MPSHKLLSQNSTLHKHPEQQHKELLLLTGVSKQPKATPAGEHRTWTRELASFSFELLLDRFVCGDWCDHNSNHPPAIWVWVRQT